MHLRTGPGRYREAMSYEYEMKYENRLNNARRMEHSGDTWEESLVADFSEFFGRLFQ